MKGKKERVEQESSSSGSSCSEDESKAEGKVKAKKESKKVNWLFSNCLFSVNYYCLLVCFYVNVYLCSVLSILLMSGLLHLRFCFSLLKSFVSLSLCMLVCAVRVSNWPLLSSVRVLLLQRCLS